MTPQQTIETANDSEWSLTDWLQGNSRLVGIGAAIIAAAAVGYWFYMRSAEIKRLNAERGLNQAKQSMAAGNAPLAQADLQRVASRYQGTQAGAQAAMLLAQVDYDQAKYAEGLKVLEPYLTASASGPSLPAAWCLTGDGRLMSLKLDESVDAYQKAAAATPFPGERAVYLAKAARAYMAGGKNAEARTLWEKLAADPSAANVRNEAEVRLGELTAAPASKS